MYDAYAISVGAFEARSREAYRLKFPDPERDASEDAQRRIAGDDGPRYRGFVS